VQAVGWVERSEPHQRGFAWFWWGSLRSTHPTRIACGHLEWARMLTYRTFRNPDPPAIAALWQSRAGHPGLLQPLSPDLLEQLVFARLYFDHGGLLLAHDEGRLVGFAHAGFGPDPEQSWISTETGVVCVVVTAPGCAETEVAAGLLGRCEEYLRQRGAKVVLAGGLRPLCPFYLGLYGGSELPGVLDSDVTVRQALAAQGYCEAERTFLFRRGLDGFEPRIDRWQMQVRRQMQVEVTVDAPTHTWWEACTLGEFDLTRFDLVVRNGGATVATALFRSVEPIGTVGVGRGVGLLGLSVDETSRRRGVATFLLNEAFRQFLRQGITQVEAQTNDDNVAAIATLNKLGLQEAARGGVWKKEC
jgi:ribosomal protein S18 acetylase RimI-like enzyme